jgi:hypothetical protein
MVLVISDWIYHSVVRHGYRGISNTDFEPLARVTVAKHHHRGWVHIPGQP